MIDEELRLKCLALAVEKASGEQKAIGQLIVDMTEDTIINTAIRYFDFVRTGEAQKIKNVWEKGKTPLEVMTEKLNSGNR